MPANASDHDVRAGVVGRGIKYTRVFGGVIGAAPGGQDVDLTLEQHVFARHAGGGGHKLEVQAGALGDQAQVLGRQAPQLIAAQVLEGDQVIEHTHV